MCRRAGACKVPHLSGEGKRQLASVTLLQTAIAFATTRASRAKVVTARRACSSSCVLPPPATRQRLRPSDQCCRSTAAMRRTWDDIGCGRSGPSGGGKVCKSPAPANPAWLDRVDLPPSRSLDQAATRTAPSASGRPRSRHR